MKNNNGPGTDHLGAPDTISLIAEAWLPIDTNGLLPLRYKWKEPLASPLIPYWSSFVNKM